MKITVLLTAVLLSLLMGPVANAANQPKAVFTFVCNSRSGICPNGGRPDSLIQGSDGNF